MGTSVVPALIDAIVAAARASLPGMTVYDGFGVSDDPGDYLMIGVDDPDRPGSANSADSVQSWAHANYTSRNEEGTVTCAALSWNGATDPKAARDAVFATAAAVENLVRATPALGVASLLWTGYGASQSLTQDQSEDGALALLIFQIQFKARI